MHYLSEEVLDNELPGDSRVWVVIDEGDLDTYLVFPINEQFTLALWAFLKKEDAEHLIYLLKENAPKYKNLELVAENDSLIEIRAGAKEHNFPLRVLAPNNSIEFFERYEELLGRYYGFE